MGMEYFLFMQKGILSGGRTMEILPSPASHSSLHISPALRRFKPVLLPCRVILTNSTNTRPFMTKRNHDDPRVPHSATAARDSQIHAKGLPEPIPSVSDTVFDSLQLFDEMPKRKAPRYAAMIVSHCRSQRWEDALFTFSLMIQDGAQPDKFLLPKILKACSETKDLRIGTTVHGYMVRIQLHPDVFVGNSLIDMYAKCGDLPSSRAVFDRMKQRDVVSWTALVNAYANAGLPDEAAGLFDAMRAEGVRPDLISWNALISGFARNGEIDVALCLWDEMQESGLHPGTNSWNGLISGCVQSGCFEDALDMLRRMCSHGNPNAVSVASILPACSGLEALSLGKELHCYVIRNGIKVNVFVGGSLIDMYLKCGERDYAERVFSELEEKNITVWNELVAAHAGEDRMSEALELIQLMMEDGLEPDVITYNIILAAYARKGQKDEALKILTDIDQMGLKPNVISMNALISGFHQSGLSSEALELFRMMQPTAENKTVNSKLPDNLLNVSIQPNAVTINSILTVCNDLKLHHQKEIHGYSLRNGFKHNVFVLSSLVDMYAKCDDMASAIKIFNGIRDKNTVSWNVLMAGYNHNGDPDAALQLFPDMVEHGCIPNSITIMILLLACSKASALRLTRELHGYIEKNRPDEYPVTLASALIDTYAKCGSILEARLVFDCTSPKDIAVWNAMMSGYSLHRMARDAISLFTHMEHSGIKPDHITFTAVLSACNQESFVEVGWKYFNTMKDSYGVSPTLEHFTCMVDIMSSAGLLEESLEFIERMPFEPDACVWATLLKACRMHSNYEIGQRAARALFGLEPTNASNYIALSNIFAMAGMWDSATNVRNAMRDRGVQMVKACSWIYLGKEIHSFKAGDRSHPEIEKILDKWDKLADVMAQDGYIPHDVVFCDEDKLDPFSCYHTEKLAVCLGMIYLHDHSPVRVSKNVRMCMDCHSSIKFISKIVGREIFVSDGCCYHHFKDGICSCGDKW